MPTLKEIEALLLDEEIARRRAVKDFEYFVRLAWHVCEPTVEFQPSWVVSVIGAHIEAVLDGRVKNLIVNIPPRMSKSTLFAVMMPAFAWLRWPGKKFMFASYASSLSTRDSIKCRRLIESEWYKSFFKVPWQMNADQNKQDEFSNTMQGHRIATAVGAGATGKGADILVVDDALRAMDAYSESMREGANTYFDEELSSRSINPKTFAKIVVMQRLHPNDLTGHLLEHPSPGTVHLNLPMEFEGDSEPNALGYSDPRIVLGELLSPNRFGEDELTELKLRLGSTAYSGQFQQRPVLSEGALVRRSWFKFYRELPWDLTQHVSSWDFATSEKSSADYTVGICGARRRGEVYILDMIRDRMEFPQAIQAFVAFSNKHPKALKKLVEDKSAGIQVIQMLKQQVPGIVPVTPKGDKLSRFMSVVPFIEAGNVYLPENAPWLSDFLTEVCSFSGEGSTRNDDVIDSLQQLLFSFVEQPAPAMPIANSASGRTRGY